MTTLDNVTAEVVTQINFQFASTTDQPYTITVNPTDQNSAAVLWFGCFDPTGKLSTSHIPSVAIVGTQPVKNVQFGYSKREGAYITFTPGGTGMSVNVMMYLLSSDQSITSQQDSVTVAYPSVGTTGATCSIYLGTDPANAVTLDNSHSSQPLSWPSANQM